MSDDWFDWPALPELFPMSFPGVQTKRDSFLIDIDLDRLRERIVDYFDANLSHEEIARRYRGAMKSSSGLWYLTPVRCAIGCSLAAGLMKAGLSASPIGRLTIVGSIGTRDVVFSVAQALATSRMVFEGNVWIEAREREAKEDFSRGTLVRLLADNFGSGFSSYFPAWLRDDGLGTEAEGSRRVNLSGAARRYLERLGASVEDLFHHVLAVLHDPAYREANAGALRMEWPRIPLPGWPGGTQLNMDAQDGQDRSAADACLLQHRQVLAESAARGRELARLLDPIRPCPASPKAPYARRLPPLPCPPPSTGAT